MICEDCKYFIPFTIERKIGRCRKHCITVKTKDKCIEKEKNEMNDVIKNNIKLIKNDMYVGLLEELVETGNIKDLCINIDCGEIIFPFCFVRKETSKFLIVDSTREDGTEGIVVISKDKILSIAVVYEQDVERIFNDDDDNDERMFI